MEKEPKEKWVTPNQEKLEAGEDAKEKYSETFNFFNSYAEDFPKQLEQAQKAGDNKAVQGIEGAKKECDYILNSLESGNVDPAVNKIAEMAERNIKFLKEKVPGSEGLAGRVKILKELIDCLTELTSPEVKTNELKET